ncbi:MAG: ferrous iron transport protein A [Verrucomicrobia bacterium]|nr:ferrous iron transport protein A [Verrucomicrobiota bacterium]
MSGVRVSHWIESFTRQFGVGVPLSLIRIVVKQYLSDLADGVPARIKDMPTGQPNLVRLREMGLLPGTRVHIVRRNVLGDPLEVAVRGSFLSVRKSDASQIEVELT